MKLYPIHIYQGLYPEHLQNAAQLYFESFRRQVSPILGVNERAVAFIRQAFNPQQALTAILDGKLAGFAGLQYSGQTFMQLHLSQFIQRFGWLLGRIRFSQATLFEQPLQDEGQLLIESIAVDPAFRGQGVGTSLINAVTEFAGNKGFHAVHIKVPNTAPALYKLSRRLGFNYVSTQSWEFLRPFNITTFVTLTKTL
jgi:ribosomal protein S18 acetylase RimI-like enzyme